ncbi:hypothetical protein HPB47_027740 [Ixodes persulcatus]|uniref:Uncharacterized protein n=1 Tax=Ixodes persulcatus TaxID=34615 RepID=A0AC60PV85_IXOPE|nr:hypothetical protein HPB47_027740 [Ixodes persulcatus]
MEPSMTTTTAPEVQTTRFPGGGIMKIEDVTYKSLTLMPRPPIDEDDWKLAEKWQPEDYPLPAKTFKRKETVQLRRIRTEGAATPRLKYHINLSQLRRTQPYAVPPDPRCQRCKDPEAIPRLDHLLLECQALALCRVEAIETPPQEERPQRLVDWTHPQGEAQRRTRILQSLLDFVAKADLGDSI